MWQAASVIDKTGEYWRGENFADLAEYLREFQADGYPVEHVNELRCPDCRGDTFQVEADDTEGCARARCGACRTALYIADSAENLDEADLAECACPCGNETFAVAVGYSLRENLEVRWISVGLRCTRDGTLGVYADWKIDYAASRHLLTKTVSRGS
jgi:Zn finger protein HypA/HybF involved in hydrogenase expression